MRRKGEFFRANDSASTSTPRWRVLVVDDELDVADTIRQILQGEGCDAVAEISARAALLKVASQPFDLVLTDVSMAEMSGVEVCRRIAKIQPELPVVMVTGRGDLNIVVAALRAGARDFLKKPVDLHTLLACVTSVLSDRGQEFRASRAPGDANVVSDLSPVSSTTVASIGQSPASLRVRAMVDALSGSLASVVIYGETGSGKELVARALHANSRVRKGPFVSVDCAAIPVGLLESEFFGHAGGAFTDARGARTGLLAQANGGTLFLDEIGELPLALQPKLLRALQERRFRPLGQNREVVVDCRIIAATNRDLREEVAEGRFREDLYYRLNVIPIVVPPLRQRGEDVLLLAEHFLAGFAKDRQLTLSTVVKEKLLAYEWPGNVRELENCLERGAALANHDELALEDLPEKVQLASAQPSIARGAAWDESEDDIGLERLPLVEFARRHVLQAVELFHGNKTRAAAVLGIDRRTLCRRLEHYQSVIHD